MLTASVKNKKDSSVDCVNCAVFIFFVYLALTYLINSLNDCSLLSTMFSHRSTKIYDKYLLYTIRVIQCSNSDTGLHTRRVLVRFPTVSSDLHLVMRRWLYSDDSHVKVFRRLKI